MAERTALARRIKIDVNSTGTPEVPIWATLVGIVENKATNAESNNEDDSDYDGDGYTKITRTALGWKLETKISHKFNPQTKLFNPVHNFLEAASSAFDTYVDLRWYDRFGAPDAKRGEGLVSWEPEGGGHDALDQVSLTIEGNGPWTAITNPVDEDPVPIVVSATPATDVAAGGARVVIRGAGFTGTTTVKFGATTAPGFTVIDDTVLVVDAPAHAAGAAAIKVTNANGESTTSAPFTYTA